jgi:hypothetical protein
MVVTKARAIAGTILTAAGALALISPAHAHPDPAPSLDYCEALPKAQVDLEFKRTALRLPQSWSSFAAVSADWLAIKTKAGSTECIDLSWIGEASEYKIYNDRFAGFRWKGYEAFGYRLIDRVGTGQILELGLPPHFSPEGNMLAALQYSDSGFGGLEGFGVWQIYENGLQPVYRISTLSPMADWRIDRWEGNNCLHISAIPYERVGDNWENLAAIRRDAFVAGGANGWSIVPGSTCPAYDAG